MFSSQETPRYKGTNLLYERVLEEILKLRGARDLRTELLPQLLEGVKGRLEPFQKIEESSFTAINEGIGDAVKRIIESETGILLIHDLDPVLLREILDMSPNGKGLTGWLCLVSTEGKINLVIEGVEIPENSREESKKLDFFDIVPTLPRHQQLVLWVSDILGECVENRGKFNLVESKHPGNVYLLSKRLQVK